MSQEDHTIARLRSFVLTFGIPGSYEIRGRRYPYAGTSTSGVPGAAGGSGPSGVITPMLLAFNSLGNFAEVC